MTVVFIFSDPSDGRIKSSSSNYNTARDGSALSVDDTTATFGTFGQWKDGATYNIYEMFNRYVGVFDPDTVITSAYFRFTSWSTHGSTSRHMETRQFSWGTEINTGDWVTPAELNSADLLAVLREIQGIGSAQDGRVGSHRLLDHLKDTGSVTVVSTSNRHRAGSAPASQEYNQFRLAETSGTATDPALVYTEVPMSTLERYIGAQVQLSDGTNVFLEHDAKLYPDNTILLKHHDGTPLDTPDIIGTISRTALGSDDGRGTQSATLVCDASDNIYVIGRTYFTESDISVFPYIKGSGHSWTPGTVRTGSLPGYTFESINNLVATWHNVGSGGTIVLVVSHEAGNNSGIEMSYGLLNCNYILTGAGSLFRNTGSAHGAKLTDNGIRAGFHNFQNETGTLMDIVAAPGSNNRGFFTSTGYGHVLGQSGRLYVSRYQLSGDGSSLSDVDGVVGSWGVKDANAKARIIGVSSSQFITLTVNSNPSVGINVSHRQNSGTASEFNILSSHAMADFGIASMPAAATLAVSNNWDAVYDPNSNSVWIYYFDAADSRRLIRTHIDLTSGQAAQDEVEVQAAVGAAGSTNHAIRVHRGPKLGDAVLVTVANETSGGTHSSIYILDDINVAPTQPTLATQENYDATTPETFSWIFNDPNAGDSQTAYEMQIKRISDGVDVVDTGKVVSAVSERSVVGGTLGNGQTYQWRVRTWDASDVVGAWSGYDQFLTSAGGTVTIIDPVADNPPDQNVSSYDVFWSVSGSVQEEYRLQMLESGVSDYLSMPGSVGSYMSTANDASLNISGDLFLAAYVAADDWTPGSNQYLVAKFDGNIDGRQYRLLVQPSGLLSFGWSVDGIADQIKNSSVPPGGMNEQGLAVAVYLDVDNGAGGHTVTFYTGPSLAGPWTQLGTPVVTAGTTSIYTGVNATAPLEVGSVQGGILPFAGKVFGVEVRSGDQAGTIVANPDLTTQTVGATSFVDGAGRTWDVLGSATIVGTSSILYDTGWVTSTDTSHIVNNIPSDQEVIFSVRIRSSGVESTSGLRKYTTSYATPPQPIIVISPMPVDGYVLVGVTNPPPDGDVVQVETNQILRRRTDSEPGYTLLGNAEVDGDFRDYTALGGVEYEYLVIGKAFSGQILSEPGLAVLLLRGVWIHDPNSPESSIKHYPYGNQSAGMGISVEQQARHYAGRIFPMVDFGENQDDVMPVAVQIIRNDPYNPESGTLMSLVLFVESRQVLMVRDGFGNGVIGSIEAFEQSQSAPEISIASFSVRRMHRSTQMVEV